MKYELKYLMIYGLKYTMYNSSGRGLYIDYSE